jgi:hypothetical protein
VKIPMLFLQGTRDALALSLPKTLSGEDSPELWNRGMLAGDGYVLRLLIGALRDFDR